MALVFKNHLCNVALWLFLSIFAASLTCASARAGTWQISYEADGANVGDGLEPWTEGAWDTNPTVDTDGNISFMAGGSKHASSIGSITAILTWQPNTVTDVPPAKVFVVDYASAQAHTYCSSYEGEFSGSADDGLRHASIQTPGSWPEFWRTMQMGWDEFVTSSGRSSGHEVNTNGQTVVRLPAVSLSADASQPIQQGPVEASVSYHIALFAPHPHPINYREYSRQVHPNAVLEFKYRWDSTSGQKAPDGVHNVDLGHIYIGELVKYPSANDPYNPSDPPFVFGTWTFNNPTVTPSIDTRNGNDGEVADTHWSGGLFRHPHAHGPFSFTAEQKYRFYCSICMNEGEFQDLIPQIFIVRRVENLTTDYENGPWEYTIHKSGLVASKDVVWLEDDPIGLLKPLFSNKQSYCLTPQSEHSIVCLSRSAQLHNR